MTPPRVQRRQVERQLRRYVENTLRIVADRERDLARAKADGRALDLDIVPTANVDQATATVRDALTRAGVDLDDPQAALAILVLTDMVGSVYSHNVLSGQTLEKAGLDAYNLVIAAGWATAEHHRDDAP